MFKEALYYTRMAGYFGRYVKLPLVPDPEAALRGNLERRAANFLELMRTGIFSNPQTPYFELMRLAGCTFEDLRESIGKHGLEATLEHLRGEGVYLTHDEVKGKAVERQRKVIANHASATANPASPGGIEAVSSGSRGQGLATPASNAYRNYRECYEVLAREELGARGRVCGVLNGVLPGPAGLLAAAGFAKCGQPAERWYAVGKSMRANGPYALVTSAMVSEARLLNCLVPYPTYLGKDDFTPVAQWIADNKRKGRLTFLRSGVSSATRVCAAAMDAGLDVQGTIFFASGEAMTPARRRVLEAAGAHGYSRYVISEMGTVGMACSHLKGNAVHLFTDVTAVIGHRRPAPFVDTEVNSLLFTSLHPEASRIFINAEMEDTAEFAPASCDCVFSRIGFRTILQDVYSFGKLSGHGMTLAGDALLRIIEERLPARFGGGPTDYQLVELEGKAQLEMRLRVSPRLGAVNSAEVHGFFLEQVRALYGGALSARTWEATSSICVEIAEPYRTSTGKVHALHLSTYGARNGRH